MLQRTKTNETTNMAQIRSKQIADFLANVNWASVTNDQIANASDVKDYVDAAISTEHSHHTAETAALVADLSSEIAATNLDFNAVNASIDSLEGKSATDLSSLEDRISAEESALAAEIAATNGDVTSINTRVAAEEAARASVDVVLSNALAAEIAATNADFTSSDARILAEEGARAAADTSLTSRLAAEEAARASVDTVLSNALAAEIAATNGDVASIDLAIAGEIARATSAESSLTSRVSSEELARLEGDSYYAEVVTGIDAPFGVPAIFDTVNGYMGGVYDLEVYVNGLKVEFTHNGGTSFELNLAYAIEPTDNIMVIGVKA